MEFKWRGVPISELDAKTLDEALTYTHKVAEALRNELQRRKNGGK